MRRLWWLLVVPLVLAACAPQAAVRLQKTVGVTLYLPQKLPTGLKFLEARRIGAAMAYLHYAGGTSSLALFESGQPIARPPDARAQSGGVWRFQAESGGQRVQGAWLRRGTTYVEVVAVGIGASAVGDVTASLHKINPVERAVVQFAGSCCRKRPAAGEW